MASERWLAIARRVEDFYTQSNGTVLARLDGSFSALAGPTPRSDVAQAAKSRDKKPRPGDDVPCR